MADSSSGGGYPSAIPGDYEALIAMAKRAYASALVNFNQQRSELMTQYGYSATIDKATGVVKNMKVNPLNPYGLYQQMLRGGAQQDEQAVNDMAARGIRGGLAHQATTQDKYQFGKDSATLGESLSSSLTNIQKQQNDAYFQEQMAIVQAQLQAAIAAMQNNMWNPANVSPTPNATTPTGAAPLGSAATSLDPTYAARAAAYNAPGSGGWTAGL